jgi:hypothetical protein
MSFQIASGQFVPGDDQLAVASSHNNWVITPISFPTFLNPNIYQLSFDITGAVGTEIEYKFLINGVYELPGSENNRRFNLGPANQLQWLPTVFFNNENGAILTGRQGWRTFGIPADVSIATFLDPIWTQGVPGSDFPGDMDSPAAPSVLTWDVVNQQWSAVSTLEQNLASGTGFASYVFDRNIFGDASSAVWPKVVSIQSQPFEAPVTISALSDAPAGLSFISNPFFEAVAWELVQTSGGILPESIWIMNANSGIEGDWLTFLDLPGRLIAPFQGFFIQNNGNTGAREVTFTESVKRSAGATFFNVSEESLVRLQLNYEEHQTGTWIRISEDGSLQSTERDAILLPPTSSRYMIVGSMKEEGVPLSIGTYPSLEQHFEFPLFLETTESGEFSFTVSSFDIASDWTLQLMDTWTGSTVQITPDMEYTFEFEANAAVSLADQNMPRNPGAVTLSEDSPRFVVIASTATTSVPVSELPQFVSLNQNYPNPFNPTTQISYELPASADVRLEVFNIQGQRVASLVNAAQTAGTHTVTFDASNLASGVYLYRLQVGAQVITKKMTLLK